MEKRRYTLSKQEKLKNKKCIEQLFLKGESFTYSPVRVVFLKKDLLLQSNQVAFSVSKKNFKSAVKRNRIKRLMREAYRLNKYDLTQKGMQLMFIYTHRKIESFSAINFSIKSILNKVNK
ncbi:MAG: ribonuclease P protein component [Flavobacteriales bacterium]